MDILRVLSLDRWLSSSSPARLRTCRPPSFGPSTHADVVFQHSTPDDPAHLGQVAGDASEACRVGRPLRTFRCTTRQLGAPSDNRRVVDVAIDLVQTSCGHAAPSMDHAFLREPLCHWVKEKGTAGLDEHRLERTSRRSTHARRNQTGGTVTPASRDAARHLP